MKHATQNYTFRQGKAAVGDDSAGMATETAEGGNPETETKFPDAEGESDDTPSQSLARLVEQLPPIHRKSVLLVGKLNNGVLLPHSAELHSECWVPMLKVSTPSAGPRPQGIRGTPMFV